MTNSPPNSPPAKVKLGPDEPARVLASGIDTLVLFLQVMWSDKEFLKSLGRLRADAELVGKPVPYVLRSSDSEEAWACNVQPYGCRGYAYLLAGNELP